MRESSRRNLARSIGRKLIVIAAIFAVLALWGAWQYSRRQAIDSESLNDYRIDGNAVTVLLVQPDVSLDIDAGLRRDYTAQLAQALAKRFAQMGYQTRELGARSDPERFGQTSRLADHAAAAAYQQRTMQTIRDAGAPVLRVSLLELRYDGRSVSEQRYRVELLDPRSLAPSWRATLVWREGRSQSIALLWHLRQNRLPPPLWDSLSELAVERMRRDGALSSAIR